MAEVAAVWGLPSSNRGVSEFRERDEAISVHIDWVAASVALLDVLQDQGWPFGIAETLAEIDVDAQRAHDVALAVFVHFFAGSGFVLADEATGGRFYKWRVAIRTPDGEFCGQIEVGGEHCYRKDGTVTCRIELTGAGCAIYAGASRSGHAKRWLELLAKLESSEGRLTRCDVAADDLQGKYPISMAQQWYVAGEFDRRGQRPKARLIDDYDSGDGKTFYVGSKTSEHQLRAYEKGRELGDRQSPWVRYEGEFRASSRKELPLDMLRRPGDYLLGAYPVLRFLQAMATRIEATKEAAICTWKSARRHLARQYGKTLRFIVHHCKTPEALQYVIESATSDQLPAWASREAAESWPEILVSNQLSEATA